jgi:hypothetical protein
MSLHSDILLDILGHNISGYILLEIDFTLAFDMILLW